MNEPKLWYHRPEWLAVLLTALALSVAAIWSQATGYAQTRDNTAAIEQLRRDTKGVPADIAVIKADINAIKSSQEDTRTLLRTFIHAEPAKAR